MLKLQRIFKNYQETGAFNEQVNLYGFIDSNVFLTKSEELGVILEVRGIDYECLNDASVDGLTKRLESALKLFDENYRVYQYLFKRNNEAIPYKLYGNPVVDTAIKNRIAYLSAKADTLFSLSVYYVILFEGSRPKRKIGSALQNFPEQPAKALGELLACFSTRKQVVLLDREISKAQTTLLQKSESFILQVSDFLPVRLLDKHEAFRVFKKTLNFAPDKLELAKLKYDTFLDYYLCESHLECHRGHLRLDDYYVKVLTLKEPSAQSFPLIFKRLLEVQANYYVVTEWKREESGKTRRIIQAKRRHFHNTKRSFFSQVNLNDAIPQDVLMDDSKESQVRELGEGIKEIELHGNYFGQFSLTVVIYDLDPAKVDRACAEFYKVFSVHDAQLYEEKYNLLNAFLAAVPGNHVFNLRYVYLLNTNYADFSFLFSLHCGEPRNRHLRQEYLAVLETNHHTPYFLNLHYRDVAHTMILGRTGAGKSFLLNFLITNLQKYAPYTFIFDLGGSFESLTHLFGGSYVRVGLESEDFKINPFSLPPTKENLDFLALFVKVLLQGSRTVEIDPATERDLYHQIENLYAVDPALRTLGVLANTLGHEMSERLARWTRGGQFGFLFDNSADIYSFLLTEISNEPNVEPDLKVFVEPKEKSSVLGGTGLEGYVRADEAEAYKKEAETLRAQTQTEIETAEAQAAEQINKFRADYQTKLQFDYRLDSKADRDPFLVSVVYHDDAFTYIKCGAREKPTLYEIKDGKPNLINFQFENGVYIVPKILDSGYLAIGKKKLTFSRQASAN